MSPDLDQMTDEELLQLEASLDEQQPEQQPEQQEESDLDNMSDEELQQLEASLDSESRELSSAERKVAQGEMEVAAGVRSVPRFLMEAPGFFLDVMDIAARKVQQPFKSAAIDTVERQAIASMYPLTPEDQLPITPRKDEYIRPGSFIRNLIPEAVQEKYQDLKEAQIGKFQLFPTYEESHAELTEQISNPESFLNKMALGDMFLFEEDMARDRRSATDIKDILTPKDTWEEYQNSVIGMGVPVAMTGGTMAAAVTGGTLGAVDKTLEDLDFEEDDRKLIAFMAGLAIHHGATKAESAYQGRKGGGQPPGGEPPAGGPPGMEPPGGKPPGVGGPGAEPPGGGGKGPGAPPDVPLEPFVAKVASDIRSPEISNGMQLTARLLGPRMKNVNMEQLEIAKANGINPTLTSITDGGVLQFGQNTVAENFITKASFDNAAKRMTGEIKNSLNQKIETITPNEFLDLNQVTSEQIGSTPFKNPVENLAESFSTESHSKYDTGLMVQDRIVEIKDQVKSGVDQLYDDVKLDPAMNNQFTPMQANLETGSMLKRKQTRGLPPEQKKALVNQLTKLDDFFNYEFVEPVKEAPKAPKAPKVELILPDSYEAPPEPAKPPPKPRVKRQRPRRISLREAITQVEDLNALIDFDETFGNQSKALIPIRRALISDIEGTMENFGRGDLVKKWNEAKAGYTDYAQTFGRENSMVYKALFTDKPEQIVNSAKTRSGLQGFLKAYEKTGKREQSYFNLQKKITQEIAGPKALLAEQLSDFNMSPQAVNNLMELKPLLQMDAQVILDDIANLSRKIRKGVSTELKRDAVRADILNSLAIGEVPYKTLKMMDTLDNIRLVKDTLSGTEQGRNFLDSLKKQKSREIIFEKASKPDGNIDLTKVSKNLRNPKNIIKLKELMPKEAVRQLQDLSRFIDKAIEGDRAFRNFSGTYTAQQNAALIQQIYSIGKNLGKGLAGGSGSLYLLGAGKTFIGLGAMYALSKLYTNPKFTQALADMTLRAKAKKNPVNAKAYDGSVKRMIGVMKEELNEKEFQEVMKLND